MPFSYFFTSVATFIIWVQIILVDRNQAAFSSFSLIRHSKQLAKVSALEYLPGFIIILDLFHVMEKLWTLCYFFCKERTTEAREWVRKYLLMLLAGKVGYMIGAIKQMVTKGKFTKSKKEKIFLTSFPLFLPADAGNSFPLATNFTALFFICQ